MPLITIITSTFNAARHLPRCRDSVLQQTFRDIEWIVQDGGSTDGTLEILRACDAPKISLASEPDTGVYDAWNKALARCTGDWLLFLGADDFLFGRDILSRCEEYLRALPDHIVFAYGGLFHVNDDQTIGGRYARSLYEVYKIMLVDHGLPFPATFVKGDIARHRRFDSTYRIAGDYAFSAELITRNNVARLPFFISGMQLGGLSSSAGLYEATKKERLRIIREILTPRAEHILQGICDYLDDYGAPCFNKKELRRLRRWDSFKRLRHRLCQISARIRRKSRGHPTGYV